MVARLRREVFGGGSLAPILRRAALAAPVGALCLAVAAPSQSAVHRAQGCASVDGLQSFHGEVSDTFKGTASAHDPGQGGTETVALSRHGALRFTLHYIGGAIVNQRLFGGGASAGSIAVDDSYDHTGTGAKGELHGGSTTVPAATAELVLYPRVCRYQIQMSFLGRGSFSGDSTIAPMTQYSGFAFTPRRPIPASLHLAGSASVDAYVAGCSKGNFANPYRPPDEQGCYEFTGSWTADYAILKQCHAPYGGTCSPQDDPEGTATISWNLVPAGKT